MGLTAFGGWGAFAPRLAGAKSSMAARSCIVLYMDGGPSHIDMFDLKPDAPAEIRGPFSSIATSVPGIRVCEHLPLVAREMHRIVQVRTMRHEQTVHDPAVYEMLTGYRHLSSAGGLRVEPSDMPHLGSALSQADLTRTSLPKFIQTPDVMKMQARILPGQNAGILPGSYDPFPVSISHQGQIDKPHFSPPVNLAAERLSAVHALAASFDSSRTHLVALTEAQRVAEFRRQALNLLHDPHAQQAFDLEREPAQVHERYGRHRQGQATLLARRLVEAGARFVTVYWGNEEQDWADGKGKQLANNPWDTHRNHFPLVAQSLFPRADQTLSALLADLADRGLLDETLVVWMGEFGRTPRISKPWASRDHWPHAFTVLLAGAGARGGAVFGKTDRYAEHVEDPPVSPADLTATILDRLGIPPETTVRTKSGAMHRLSLGRAQKEWFTS